MRRFRLIRVRSPLLTESMALSFPVPTKMFQFGTFCFSGCPEMTRFYSRRVSPFGHPRIEACSAATRGISQLAASFVASRSQGIPHVPLVAYPHILELHHAEYHPNGRWYRLTLISLPDFQTAFPRCLTSQTTVIRQKLR